MSLLQRSATLAAVTLALVGFAGTSAPGQAADLNRPAVIPAVLTQPVNNTGTPLSVPTPAPAPQAAVDPAIITTAPIPTTPASPPVAEREKFASLAAAIAAQDQQATTDAVRCLATAVYFESKSEPVAGQLAVAQVIINRSKSGRFPPDVCGVVKQRGQFSFVHGGALPAINATCTQYRTAMAVAKVALAAAWDSPAPNALFFHARSVSTTWKAIKVAAIGNHIFYR